MGFLSGITRGLEDVATGGLAEFAQKNPFGVPNGQQYLPIVAGGALGAMAGNPMAGIGIGAGIFSANQQAAAQNAANQQNWAIAQAQMQFSADQAQKQRDYQTQMSSTVYQRGAKDMAAAGLNPMLAAGAPSPMASGAMPSIAGATMQPIPSTGAAISASAQQALQTLQGLRESNSRIALNLDSASTQWTQGQKNYLTSQLLEQNISTAKMQNQMLQTEVSAVAAHPGLAGYMKMLNDRGLSTGSALGAGRLMMDLAAE